MKRATKLRIPKLVKVKRARLAELGDAITHLGHAVWLLAANDVGAINRRARAARRKPAA